MKNLLTPLKLGNLTLKNRFMLAPMTRMRGELDGTPNDLMSEYYEQRKSFGLIITECNYINPTANTYPGNGALFNKSHVDGWKRIVENLHKKGGHIAVQVYHVGRSGNKSVLGADAVAPSPIAINGVDFLSSKPYETPKELTKSQINRILEEFQNTAALAKEVGFDGIQLHGANGYLVDQFLRDETNKRTDEYGGSVENRSRFLLEVTDRLIDGFSADKVSVRLSPTDRFSDMYDSNPLKLMQYALPQLDKRGLQFVEIKRNAPYDPTKQRKGRDPAETQIPDFYKTLRALLKKTAFVGNQSFTVEEANKLIEEGSVDAISFGALGIANPDLAIRVANNYPLNHNIDFTKAYVGGSSGYTDYPSYKASN